MDIDVIKSEYTSHSKATLYETNFTWIIDHVSFIQNRIKSPIFKLVRPMEKVDALLYIEPVPKGTLSFKFYLIPRVTFGKCSLSFLGDLHPFNKEGLIGGYIDVHKYLQNDRLIVNLKIGVLGGRCERLFNSRMNNLELMSFKQFLNNAELSDITLEVEGRHIFAHSQILSMRSSVFKKMLTADGLSHLKLDQISYQTAFEMLRFIYTNVADNFKDIPKDLLIAAIRYDLKSLQKMCLDAFTKKIDVSNVIDFFKFAAENSILELKTSTLDFIRNNLKHLKDTSEYKKLIENDDFLELILIL